jgi:hypothetical protein
MDSVASHGGRALIICLHSSVGSAAIRQQDVSENGRDQHSERASFRVGVNSGIPRQHLAAGD